MTIDAEQSSRKPPVPTRPLNTTRTSLAAASVGLAKRELHNIRRLPSAFLPALLMPVFQAIAFSGTFYAITRIPGFPTDRSINWFLPLAVLMGSGFTGIGVGLAAVRDIENGFYDRLRTAPTPRASLITGPLLGALARSAIVTTIVVVVGSLFGARLIAGPIGLLPLYIAGFGLAATGTGWGLGLAFRFQDMRAAALMQLTLFIALFLTDAQVPLFIMEGWLHTVARANPFTNILRLAREGWVTEITWDNTWGGLLALGILSTLTLWFARRGLNHLDE
jgi:ABC-type multidrug transport system permease subunit